MADDPSVRIIDAALALAARQGWRRTSLAAIAEEAGLPLLEVYRVYRSKHAILEAFRRRVDEAVLDGHEPEVGERPRDRLFDVLMRRLDVLQPHKEAIRALLRETRGDPAAALAALPGVACSMAWMLEAARLDASGWRGLARAHLLAGIYASLLSSWLADESPDMVKTMAALDRRLRSVEPWLVGRGPAPQAAESP